MRVDLHTHTSASDGELEPEALLAMEEAAGVDLLAITDHDTLAGWDAIGVGTTARTRGLRLIPGIEFSAVFGTMEVHIVGLGFDPQHLLLRDAIAGQQRRRRERAVRIADRLDYLGVAGALEYVERIAAGAPPGRPHFARFLVESGRVRSTDDAFKRYLGKGKPAAVPLLWPDMAEVVAWIRDSGGRAVLAHPLAYDLSRVKLRALVGQFAECGGAAIEVALPNMHADELRAIADLALRHTLMGSAGSDFHAPAQSWRYPHRIPQLPESVEPVWHDWI